MTTLRSPYAIYDHRSPTGLPALDVDPFSAEFFSDPYPAHALIRDSGPVVWLTRYAVAACGRYEQVQQALKDWKTFSSARGVGMADFEVHGRFRLPSIILEADPPQHTRSRSALNKTLGNSVVRGLHERFAAVAEEMVGKLAAKGEFDACTELAEAFPLRVFPDAIGCARKIASTCYRTATWCSTPSDPKMSSSSGRHR